MGIGCGGEGRLGVGKEGCGRGFCRVMLRRVSCGRELGGGDVLVAGEGVVVELREEGLTLFVLRGCAAVLRLRFAFG